MIYHAHDEDDFVCFCKCYIYVPQSVVISCVDNLPGKASLAEGGWWKERGVVGGGLGGN